jgi:hypothetical protein
MTEKAISPLRRRMIDGMNEGFWLPFVALFGSSIRNALSPIPPRLRTPTDRDDGRTIYEFTA